jgi:hypothetical protein
MTHTRQPAGTTDAIRDPNGWGLDRSDPAVPGWYIIRKTDYYGPSSRVSASLAYPCVGEGDPQAVPPDADADDVISGVLGEEGEWSWGCRNLDPNAYAQSIGAAHWDGRRVRRYVQAYP